MAGSISVKRSDKGSLYGNWVESPGKVAHITHDKETSQGRGTPLWTCVRRHRRTQVIMEPKETKKEHMINYNQNKTIVAYPDPLAPGKKNSP